MDIVASRLSNQRLAGSFDDAQTAIAHFGAVQAQLYSASKWGLAQRVPGLTSEAFDQLFNTGKILRTHVLRPTWHFVLPEDIRWMLELSAPRIGQAMAYYNRKLELDKLAFDKCSEIFTRALSGGNYLTRKELAQALATNGFNATGQRLGHVVMQAELDGVICSGPLRGKQFTYALLEDRVPSVKKLTREESLALLTERYFTSHGPATLADFGWWSGLTLADAKRGLQLVTRKLHREIRDGKEYWFSDTNVSTKQPKPKILLLSVYDEYIIAYKDYAPVFGVESQGLTSMFGNALLAYILIKDGRAIGTWRRTFRGKNMDMYVSLQSTLNARDRGLLGEAAETYASFMGSQLNSLRIMRN